MSDKYNKRQLVDQGWKEMSRLLDRDMPVTKKDRKFLWYFLVPVILLMGVGIGFGIYSMFDQTENEPPKQEEYVPMADIESKALNSTTPQIEHAEELQLQPLAQIVERQKEYESVNNNITQNSDLSPENSKYTAIENVTDGTQKTLVQNDQPDTQPNTNLNLEVLENAESEGVRKMETESVVLPIQSDLAAGVRRIDFLNKNINGVYSDRSIVFEEPEFVFEPVIKPVSLNSKQIGFSAGLRASFNGSLGVQGIGIGPEARFSVGRNLGMYVGVLYEFQNKNGLLNFRSNEDAALAADMSPNTNFNDLSNNQLAAVSASATYQDIKMLSNSFHYLHMPLGLEYAIYKSFSLHGGVRLSRLLSAPSKYNIAVVQGDANGQDLENLSGYSNNALFENDFVRKNDISATLGASLYLGKKWALSAEYNHGLLPIIGKDDTDGSNAYNRIFSVGLRYHFSRY